MALALFAADGSGAWTGTMSVETAEGESGSFPIYCVLKVSESQLSGTCGPLASDQRPIANGKVEGPKLSFEMGSTKPMSFSCTPGDQEMKCDVKRDGYEKASASLKRAKD